MSHHSVFNWTQYSRLDLSSKQDPVHSLLSRFPPGLHWRVSGQCIKLYLMFGDDTVNVEEWEGKNFIYFILRDRERESKCSLSNELQEEKDINREE